MKHLKVSCSISPSKRKLMLSERGLRLIFPLNVLGSHAGWIGGSYVRPVICSPQEAKKYFGSNHPIKGYWPLLKHQSIQFSKRLKPTDGYLWAVPFNVRPFLPSTWKSSQLFLPLTTLEGRTRHVVLIMSDTDYPPTAVMY